MIPFLRIAAIVIVGVGLLVIGLHKDITPTASSAPSFHRGTVADAATSVTGYAITNNLPPPNGPLNPTHYGTCDDTGNAFVVHVVEWKPHFHFTLTCGTRVAYQGPTF